MFSAHAQTSSVQTSARPTTSPVMMLSDIHFDPFRDPAKVDALRAARPEEWASILAKPMSATQGKDFAALGETCKERGLDTAYPLLAASLSSAQKQMPKPLFVTVSGDMMAHGFDCRFKQLAPKATESEYSAFAAKTIAFIAVELKRTFPGAPIYFALGNNDSGCTDYRETTGSAFLKATGETFAADVLNTANSKAILAEFSSLGDYSVALPAPIQHGRLIVLQDMFESKRFKSCNATDPQGNMTPTDMQIAWLKQQLKLATDRHEQVWVMAHIPPGIDVYSTFSKARDVCAGQPPETFLGSDALATTLANSADVVRLAIFAHSHMDELRLLAPPIGPGVPTKLVPSISPVNGNNSSFTVAQVDPKTVTMTDYTVYAANNQTGIDTTFSEEYTFSAAYKMPDFGAASLAKLTAEFTADLSGSAPKSLAYQKYFFVGNPAISANAKAAAMRLVWHAYACSVAQSTEAGYRGCLCPAAPVVP